MLLMACDIIKQRFIHNYAFEVPQFDSKIRISAKNKSGFFRNVVSKE